MPNIANVLKANGYRTAAVGKWHLAGFDTIQNVIDHPNTSGFDYYGGIIASRRPSLTGLTVTGYFQWEHCVNGACTLNTDYLTTVTTDEAIGQLAGTEPFFLYVPYNSAHDPPHDPPANLHSFAGQCLLTAPPSNPVCHKAMTEALDTELARLLAAIDMNDTTVILLGDNGSPGPTVEPPFDEFKVKGTSYQGGINVPFIVAGEAVAVSAEGQVSSALIGVTDIFATVMELAGLPDTTVDSTSFATFLSNPSAASIRQTLYTETYVPNGGPPNPGGHKRAARGARYKLINNPYYPEEFYDLALDPLELAPLDILTLDPAQANAFNELAPLVGATPVPEPSAALLTGMAVCTVMLLKRRRTRVASS